MTVGKQQPQAKNRQNDWSKVRPFKTIEGIEIKLNRNLNAEDKAAKCKGTEKRRVTWTLSNLQLYYDDKESEFDKYRA